ncbi:DMT family transporter [Halomonas halmophila]|nr:DMT family transporter [Halomonas halmophila]
MRHSASIGLLSGFMTVILWASLPLLRALVQLPPMLTAAIAMLAAAVVALGLERWRAPDQRPEPDKSAGFWLMGVGGLTGALYFYFLALDEGDPAKVTLVTYTWPVGFMLVADRLAGRGLRIETLLGALVAFSGLAPLILNDSESVSTPPLAYAAGLAAGLSWIVFSLYLKTGSPSRPTNYKRLFGGVAATALCLHLLLEPAAEQSTARDWLMASLIGIGPYGIAFMTWGFALQRCSTTLLGLMTYLVPVLSSLFVVVMGWAPLSNSLLVAVTAVFISGAITQASLPRPRFAHEPSNAASQPSDTLPPIPMPAMPPLGVLSWARRRMPSKQRVPEGVRAQNGA